MASATTTNANQANGTSAPGKDCWGITVGGGGGSGTYVCCPADTYPATIIGVYDVGSHEQTGRDGSKYQQRKLVLVFELAEKRPDGDPFVLGEKYTYSMSDKANLYGLATTLTGKKYSNGENFDPRVLLGKVAMVAVSNMQSNGKSYHNIAGVVAYPKGMPVPERTYPTVAWSVAAGEPFPTGMDWLPWIYGKSVKELAETCEEARRAASMPAGGSVPAGMVDSDIPF